MIRRLLLGTVAAAALASAAHANNYTPDQLTQASSIGATDLMLVYPSGGPMKSVQFSVLSSQIQSYLGSQYLQVSNNLSDLNSAYQARVNLGLGSAATQNTGTAGAVIPLLSNVNIWSGKQSFAASASGGAGVNLGQGTAPGSPVNGDVWITSGGFYVGYGGGIVQMQPLLGYTPVNKAGDTMSGTLTAPALVINGAAGTVRNEWFQTSGVGRWQLLANNTAETGSNVGTDFGICRYSDAGSGLDCPITITRSNGGIEIADTLGVNGLLTVSAGLNVIGGSVAFSSAVAANGGLSVSGGNLTVTGNTNVSNTTNALNFTGSSYGGIGQYDANFGSGSTWYNAGMRNDGGNVYLLSSNVQSTQAAAKTAPYNSFRPFFWNLSTGAVTIDGSGSGATFGGTVTASAGFIGNASTASTLQTARNIALSGDVSGSASFNGSAAANITATLASSGVSAGTYGDSGHVAQVTVDAKGRVTGASAVAINGAIQHAEFQNQQADSGGSGETFSATTWTARHLNTTISNTISGASLGSNQVTLPAGTYTLNAFARIYIASGGGAATIRLRNVTDSTTALVGPWIPAASGGDVTQQLQGTFTLSASKTLELDAYENATGTSTGGSVYGGSGEVEVYVDALFQKVG